MSHEITDISSIIMGYIIQKCFGEMKIIESKYFVRTRKTLWNSALPRIS